MNDLYIFDIELLENIDVIPDTTIIDSLNDGTTDYIHGVVIA
jgi:hypothetical protein